MKKISFKDIDDEDEFWLGAIFRKYGTLLNNLPVDEDYYEYMLFLDQGNPDRMFCAKIDKWSAGHVIAYIKLSRENGRLTVKAKDFKYSMILPREIDCWFFMDGGIRETRIKKKDKNKKK